MGMRSLRAACAAATGSILPVAAPSESRTMADGGRLPFTPGARLRMLVAAVIASPVPVPPRAVSWSSAWSMATRSRVGEASTRGLLLSAMTPTLTVLGTCRHEALGGGARGDQARRAHVGGLHRAADVGDEHDRRALDRHRDGLLRARGGEDEDRQREQEGEHRHVHAPARAVRRHRGGHRGRREGGRGAAAVALVRAVEHDEHGDGQQEDQHQGCGEAHGEDAHGEWAHGVCAGRFCERRVEASRPGRSGRRGCGGDRRAAWC